MSSYEEAWFVIFHKYVRILWTSRDDCYKPLMGSRIVIFKHFSSWRCLVIIKPHYWMFFTLIICSPVYHELQQVLLLLLQGCNYKWVVYAMSVFDRVLCFSMICQPKVKQYIMLTIFLFMSTDLQASRTLCCIHYMFACIKCFQILVILIFILIGFD